jgi:hypothetical protein
MNLVLLLSIILAAQLPLYTFGKSSVAVKAITEGPKSHEEASSSIVTEKDDAKTTRMRRNSLTDDDAGDFLINKLSREYVTSNLFDSTCDK